MTNLAAALSAPTSKRQADLFIFDLDGTIIDGTSDIARAVNFTLAHFGQPPLPRETIAMHIGHGVRNLMEQTLNISGEAFEAALKIMLTYYHEHCLEETTTYPTVLETLHELKNRGKLLSVCTNKSISPTEKILTGLGIRPLLTTVVGGNSFSEKKPHPMGLEYILAEAKVSPSRAVMIGDSQVDVEVGKRAGLTTCGCSFGLRPLAELQAAAPDLLLHQMDEIFQHFT